MFLLAQTPTATEAPAAGDAATSSDAAGAVPSEPSDDRGLWEKVEDYWREFDWSDLADRAQSHIRSENFWIDIGVVALSLVVGLLVARWLGKRRDRISKLGPMETVRSWLDEGESFPLFPATFTLVLWVAVLTTGPTGVAFPILRIVTVIATGWFLIQLVSLMDRQRFWIKPLAILIILTVVLQILGWRVKVVEYLNAMAISIGDFRISILSLILVPLTFLVAYGIGRIFTKYAERRLARNPEVPPTVQVLSGKLMQFLLVVVVIWITLTVAGIDLTALTVFGGALGLGIGFGLQKVISNLFSGIILLLDRSIKPGDVIEIGNTYGRINGLRTRYVSVITRDNKEFLIPNEDLITQPVINWSFSDQLVRLRAPIGVSYDSDLREVIRLCEEAASSQERVRKDPAPRCLLRGFGDNSVDLELRFWIIDPGDGCGNITSAVLLAVWDAFKEHDIEIPFPQRDLHIRSGGEVIREVVPPDNPDPD